MNNLFDQALAFTLVNEGGYTNNPADSGGPTNFGITQNDLALWRGSPVGPDDVKNMQKSEASSIYFMHYWKPLGCEGMTQLPIVTTLFDSGVLYGIHTSAVTAQNSLKICGYSMIEVDGQMGTESVSALNVVEAHSFLIAYTNALKLRINSLIAKNPKNAVFLQGWINRADKLLTLV